jgi:hypothetical protein
MQNRVGLKKNKDVKVKVAKNEGVNKNEVNVPKNNKVKKNGFWVFDDTNWETTQKAQKLLESYGYKEIYDSGSWKIYKRT